MALSNAFQRDPARKRLNEMDHAWQSRVLRQGLAFAVSRFMMETDHGVDRMERCGDRTDAEMMRDKDMQILAGETVARTMLIRVLLEQIVETGSDRAAAARKAVSLCIRAIRMNRDMTEAEKQGAVQIFEEAQVMCDQIASDLYER